MDNQGLKMEITHACPIGSERYTSCCNKLPSELPMTDRLTLDPTLVNCKWPAYMPAATYWRLTAALGRALDYEESQPEYWTVVEELTKEFPEFDWHNAMTDGDHGR